MPNVTRKYQSHVIKCEAQNAVGLSADSETLDVICKHSALVWNALATHTRNSTHSTRYFSFLLSHYDSIHAHTLNHALIRIYVFKYFFVFFCLVAFSPDNWWIFVSFSVCLFRAHFQMLGLFTNNNDHQNPDPPSFIERPQSIESEIGENITMHCIVDSNPKADIIWVFDPIDRVRLY